jgi:outer membrane protein assembly factor BamB
MICRQSLCRLVTVLTLAAMGTTVAACGASGTTRSTPNISVNPHFGPPSATVSVSGNGIGTSDTNSPQFHFNAARSGFNPDENVISPSNVFRLATAWTDTVSNSVNSSPAVVNGIAYVSAGNGFYAFDAATGTLRWSDPGIFFNQSAPAVVNGVAYAAGVDGRFYAFSTNVRSANCSGTPVTCKPLWTAAIDGAGSVAQPSPAVANGIVYVTAGYNLYAFSASGCSAATCKPLWTAATSRVNGQSPASGQSSPTVVGGCSMSAGSKASTLTAPPVPTGAPAPRKPARRCGSVTPPKREWRIRSSRHRRPW